MFTVSVCCITYKHEQFLSQAIESVLAQQTDFKVEMVISDDCSPDGTSRVAQEYAHRYPDQVRVLTRTHNLGIMPNLIATWGECQGDYIAFLEGDDYWTDTTKLQRQVDALRQNLDCSLCFHDAEAFYDDHLGQDWTFHERFNLPTPNSAISFRRYTQADIVRKGWFIPSASMLFRASSLPQPLPAWLAGVFSGDFSLQLLSTQQGAALYLPRLMSRYRLHHGGVMQTSSNSIIQNTKRIHEGEWYKRFLPKELHSHIDIYLEYLYSDRSEKLGNAGYSGQKLYFYIRAMVLNKKRMLFHVKRLFFKTVGG